MAVLFLSTSFIYLASDQVGCVALNEEIGEDEIVEDCDAKVYGAFSPASLITNVATISGVLVAVFLPVIGAIIDYTPHRWTVGVVSAILLVLTELAQVFTNSNTWFAMAVIEAISGLFFEVQLITAMAYLPEVAKTVEERSMNRSKLVKVAVVPTQLPPIFNTCHSMDRHVILPSC